MIIKCVWEFIWVHLNFDAKDKAHKMQNELRNQILMGKQQEIKFFDFFFLFLLLWALVQNRLLHISSLLMLIDFYILGLEWANDLQNTRQRTPADHFCSSISCLLTWSSRMLSFLVLVGSSISKQSMLRRRQDSSSQLKTTHRGVLREQSLKEFPNKEFNPSWW